MKKKKYVGAAIFMAVAVAAAVPLGVNRSLARLQEEAADAYYYDQTGYVIYEGIDLREAAAKNLITVAERYSGENPQLQKLMDELDHRVQVSQNTYEYDDKTFAKIAAANAALDQPARELAAELEKLELSEKDKKYPAQIIAQMDSEQDKIKRSSYNDGAREYNQKLASLKPIALLSPLAVFEGPGSGQASAAAEKEPAVDGAGGETVANAEQAAAGLADRAASQADQFAGDVAEWAENLGDEIAGRTEEMVDGILDSIFE